MARLGWFILGIVVTIVVLIIFAFVFITTGGIQMAATAKPLPLEETVAHMALHASFGDAAAQTNPLPENAATITAGAGVYLRHCAGCHGTPAHTSGLVKMMFPPPPQLFQKNQMVTDDPQGITHWKVTHGIRLSGMPSFAGALTDEERWQVTMLLKNADKLPPAAQAALSH